MSRHSLPVPERGFVSTSPAEIWEEGLICGNGTIGINALSRALDERIIFIHEQLFMPMGAPVVPLDQSANLSEIRELIAAGKYKEACALQFEGSGQESFLYPDFFVPAFDLTLGNDAVGRVRDYARSVDFQTGEAVIHWADDRGAFERRMFVSREDGVAVILLTGPGAGSLNCRLKLEPRQPSTEFNHDSDIAMTSDEMFKLHFENIRSTADDSSLSYRCEFTKAYPGSIEALEGQARVIATYGTRKPDDDGSLVIERADRILIFVDIRLLHDRSKSETKSMSASLAALPEAYDKLLKAHAKLHGGLFNRVRLDLGGGSDHARSTEDLLRISDDEMLNRALMEKEFYAGRHNIISATGKLPPALQGLWGGTYVPGWAGDYTHNGNLPSAISSNLTGNMPELMAAYTCYIESLVPDMETNARHLFGARGIMLPSRSTTHGYNNALAPDFAGGMWLGGAGWAARFFYDFYQYTGDRDFLARHALPFMEKAALFFEDFLFEGEDGKYDFSPYSSPENTPLNSNSQGTFNATMDVAVAKELLINTISASRELERNADKIPVWETMLVKMPDYQFASDHTLKEWLTPRLQNNNNHRHSSQLYALFAGQPDEIANSPELREVFKNTIESKLEHHWKDNQRGEMSFGLVQLGQASASLGEGELAYHCLRHLVNRSWLSNLASTHNHRALFNMDVSGGMPSVIIRMLVASSPGVIRPLPALPAAWPMGCIEGIVCHGGIVVKRLHWEGNLIDVELSSTRGYQVTLVLPSPIADLTCEIGNPPYTAGSNQLIVTLQADHRLKLRISLRPE